MSNWKRTWTGEIGSGWAGAGLRPEAKPLAAGATINNSAVRAHALVVPRTNLSSFNISVRVQPIYFFVANHLSTIYASQYNTLGTFLPNSDGTPGVPQQQ
jgi:hypothetical protein